LPNQPTSAAMNEAFERNWQAIRAESVSTGKHTMGLFSHLFRRQPQPATDIVEAIERLQVALLSNLTIQYSSRFPSTDALNLANCVLSYAMLVEPTGVDARQYNQSHSQLVRDEAAQLSTYAHVAKAFSYLYAALTIHIAIQTRSPFSEPTALLGTRATELSFDIPNAYDICGTDDFVECVSAIRTFAQNYMREARGAKTK
jgi:hypothetical protein